MIHLNILPKFCAMYGFTHTNVYVYTIRPATKIQYLVASSSLHLHSSCLKPEEGFAVVQGIGKSGPWTQLLLQLTSLNMYLDSLSDPVEDAQ